MTGKLGYGPVMKYTSIFFDWDGTLVNSLGVIVKAHNHVRVAFGLEPWEMIDYFGNSTGRKIDARLQRIFTPSNRYDWQFRTKKEK